MYQTGSSWARAAFPVRCRLSRPFTVVSSNDCPGFDVLICHPPAVNFRGMNELTQWAWLAGIFEGEGTIAFCGKSGVMVRIGMTDKDVIDTIHRLYPAPSKWLIETKHRIKPLYMWQIADRDDCRDFLGHVMPYLHARRRARAEAALQRLESNRGAKSKRTVCPLGHPLSGDNLYIAATTGSRSCRACRKRRDVERQQQRVAARASQRAGRPGRT